MIQLQVPATCVHCRKKFSSIQKVRSHQSQCVKRILLRIFKADRYCFLLAGNLCERKIIDALNQVIKSNSPENQSVLFLGALTFLKRNNSFHIRDFEIMELKGLQFGMLPNGLLSFKTFSETLTTEERDLINKTIRDLVERAREIPAKLPHSYGNGF